MDVHDWLDEDGLEKLKADRQPFEAPTSHYTPKPNEPGKLFWFSGKWLKTKLSAWSFLLSFQFENSKKKKFGNFFQHVKKLLNFWNFVNIKVAKSKLNHLGFYCKLYFFDRTIRKIRNWNRNWVLIDGTFKMCSIFVNSGPIYNVQATFLTKNFCYKSL